MQEWGISSTMFGLFAAGFMYFVFAALIKWRGLGAVHRLLPPVVIGPVIMVIGLSVAVVASNMAMGKSGDQQVFNYTHSLLLSGFTFAVTVIVTVFGSKMMRLIPILIGVAAGYILALITGMVDTSAMAAAPWFAVPHFITPQINWQAALFMLPVAIAPAIEHIGGIMAISKVTGEDYVQSPGLHRTLFGDGLGVCVAGLIGGPPVTTYGEVTGAVMITKNSNPVIMTWAAIFAIFMAFFGKFNAFLSSIPLPHARNRYQAGYSSYLEVLDSQRTLLSVQSLLIQSKADYLNSQVSLYQALGGGWSISTNQVQTSKHV